MNSTVTLQEAREIAEREWGKIKGKKSIERRKCNNCYDNWNLGGRKLEEMPPVFPSEFEGNCPVCGSELSRPSIPF